MSTAIQCRSSHIASDHFLSRAQFSIQDLLFPKLGFLISGYTWVPRNIVERLCSLAEQPRTVLIRSSPSHWSCLSWRMLWQSQYDLGAQPELLATVIPRPPASSRSACPSIINYVSASAIGSYLTSDSTSLDRTSLNPRCSLLSSKLLDPCMNSVLLSNPIIYICKSTYHRSLSPNQFPGTVVWSVNFDCLVLHQSLGHYWVFSSRFRCQPTHWVSNEAY